jgi:hypothetical protein
MNSITMSNKISYSGVVKRSIGLYYQLIMMLPLDIFNYIMEMFEPVDAVRYVQELKYRTRENLIHLSPQIYFTNKSYLPISINIINYVIKQFNGLRFIIKPEVKDICMDSRKNQMQLFINKTNYDVVNHNLFKLEQGKKMSKIDYVKSKRLTNKSALKKQKKYIGYKLEKKNIQKTNTNIRDQQRLNKITKINQDELIHEYDDFDYDFDFDYYDDFSDDEYYDYW